MRKVGAPLKIVEAVLINTSGLCLKATAVSLSGPSSAKSFAAPSRIGAVKRANQATSRERAMARAAYKQRGISSISVSGKERCRSCKSQGIAHVDDLPPYRPFFLFPFSPASQPVPFGLLSCDSFRLRPHKTRNTEPGLSYFCFPPLRQFHVIRRCRSRGTCLVKKKKKKDKSHNNDLTSLRYQL